MRRAPRPLALRAGRPAGGEIVQDCLTCLSEARSGAAFLSLDFENAYNSLERASVQAAVEIGRTTLVVL